MSRGRNNEDSFERTDTFKCFTFQLTILISIIDEYKQIVKKYVFFKRFFKIITVTRLVLNLLYLSTMKTLTKIG